MIALLLFYVPFISFWAYEVKANACSPGDSLPHPKHCESFYLCDDSGVPHHFVCSQRLHYNAKKGRCDWADKAECHVSDGGYGENEHDKDGGKGSVKAEPVSKWIVKPVSEPPISEGSSGPGVGSTSTKEEKSKIAAYTKTDSETAIRDGNVQKSTPPVSTLTTIKNNEKYTTTESTTTIQMAILEKGRGKTNKNDKRDANNTTPKVDEEEKVGETTILVNSLKSAKTITKEDGSNSDQSKDIKESAESDKTLDEEELLPVNPMLSLYPAFPGIPLGYESNSDADKNTTNVQDQFTTVTASSTVP